MKSVQFLFLDDVNGLEEFINVENLVLYFSNGKVVGWLDMTTQEFENSYGGLPVEHFYPTEEDVEKIKVYLDKIGIERCKGVCA